MTSIFWNSECVETMMRLRSVDMVTPGRTCSEWMNRDFARSASMSCSWVDIFSGLGGWISTAGFRLGTMVMVRVF